MTRSGAEPYSHLGAAVSGEKPQGDAALHRYLPALDGLRAIAILWVISLHLPGQLPPLGNPLTRRGHFGVELFFAISGFLVTRSLHQCVVRAEREGGGGRAVFRDFVARRISRIWPPFFLTLALAFAGLALDPVFRSHASAFLPVAWTFPAFLANYAIPYYEPSLSLLVLWSLCFEEQFYAILILFHFLSNGRLASWLFGAALVSIGLRLSFALFAPQVFIKYVMQMQLHWRFDAIAWGCLIWIGHVPIEAFFRSVKRPRLVEAAIVLVAALVCIPQPEGPLSEALGYLVIAPCFALLVAMLAFLPGSGTARLLGAAPLVFVGVISYEIYLTHVSVYRVLERLAGAALPRSLYYALCFGLSLAVGALFHRLFSKPTQRWMRKRLDAPPLVTS